MNTGYYSACAGLRAESQALEVVANNLSNLNTPGFLGGQPTFRSLLVSAGVGSAQHINLAISHFNSLGDTRLDLSSGNLQKTDNPLDLAIEGKGFFAVQTKAGTLYTRNGGFQVSPQGQLTTASGDLVLGDRGPVSLPAGKVVISGDGTISVDGAVAGKVRVVEFGDNAALEPVGESMYSASDADTRPATSSSVRQGMLAASNVNPIASVVRLIAVQRQAEMMQRVLSIYYSDFNRIAAADLPRV